MNRKTTKKVDESTLTTLCAVCRGAFLDAKGVRLRRADPRQLVKDVCTYCQTRYGFDYYKDKAAATGSIMLCELQGATEEFIFRWNVIFQEHPDVLTDKTCRKTIFELLDRMTNYLKTVKEEKL